MFVFENSEPYDWLMQFTKAMLSLVRIRLFFKSVMAPGRHQDTPGFTIKVYRYSVQLLYIYLNPFQEITTNAMHVGTNSKVVAVSGSTSHKHMYSQT